MSSPEYITLRSNQLALKKLLEQIQSVLSSGVSTLGVTGQISFTDTVEGTVGAIKYNQTSGAIQYSNDGGTSWSAMSSQSLRWVSGKSYQVNDVVLYGTGWYACRTATASAIPGSSAQWRLLTVGSQILFASNAQQLSNALQTSGASICIYLTGNITSSISATVSATTVTIWSDETVSIQSSIYLTAASANTNVYWHASGTKLGSSITLSAATCSLWLQRMSVITGSITLSGNVYYQSIAGSVSGGTQSDWIYSQSGSYVPLNLAQLTQATYASTLKLYVNQGTTYGYTTIGVLLQKVASEALQYAKIDKVDVLANRPTQASQGYVFYASDTGDVYIMGLNNTWGAAVHIQGPTGAAGEDGQAGTMQIVSVSMTEAGTAPQVTEVNTAYFTGSSTAYTSKKFTRDSTHDPYSRITANAVSYNRATLYDTTTAKAWISAQNVRVYTETDTPTAGTSYCYTDTQLTQGQTLITAFLAAKAWTAADSTTVYTTAETLTASQSKYYSDTACTQEAGTVTVFAPKSTSTNRTYDLSIPQTAPLPVYEQQEFTTVDTYTRAVFDGQKLVHHLLAPTSGNIYTVASKDCFWQSNKTYVKMETYLTAQGQTTISGTWTAIYMSRA